MRSVEEQRQDRRVRRRSFSGQDRRRPGSPRAIRVWEMADDGWLAGECSCGQRATSMLDGVVEAWIMVHRWESCDTN
jgi:hypothetical protein